MPKQKTTPETVCISEEASVKRVNRRLKKDDQKIVRLRGRAAEEYGRYVLVPIPSLHDVAGHGARGPLSRIERMNVDVASLARELGVLRPWETVVEGGAT